MVHAEKSSKSEDLKELGRSLSRFCEENLNQNINHQVLQSYAMDVFVNYPLLLSALKDIFSKNDFWRMNSASSQIEAFSSLSRLLNELRSVYRDEIVEGIRNILTAFNEHRGFCEVKVITQNNPQTTTETNSATIQRPLVQIPKPNAPRIDGSPKGSIQDSYPRPKSDLKSGFWGYLMPLLTIIFYLALFYSQNKETSGNFDGNNGTIKQCVEQVHGYCLYP